MNRKLNVQTDFGAIGDGVADDTAALQAGIDASITDSVALYLPAGDYGISSTLLIDTNLGTRISMVGDGEQSKIQRLGASFTGLSMIESNTDDVQNPSTGRTLTKSLFRDFFVECDFSASRCNFGINIPVITHSHLHNVFVNRPALAGWLVDYQYSNAWFDCVANNSRLHGFVLGVETLVVNQTTMTGCRSWAHDGVGYAIQGGNSVRLLGCLAERCKQGGIYVNSTRGGTLSVYCELNAEDGLVFNTHDGSGLFGAPLTIKADITFNGTSAKIDPTTLVIPDDVKITNATTGFDIEYLGLRLVADDTYGVAFMGCRGINIVGWESDNRGKNFYFHGGHNLAQFINIGPQGDSDHKRVGSDITVAELGHARLANFREVAIHKCRGLPIQEWDLSTLTKVVGAEGTFAVSPYSVNDNPLWRLGDTSADSMDTATIGKILDMGEWPDLASLNVSLLVEYYMASNYNDGANGRYGAGCTIDMDGNNDFTGTTAGVTAEIETLASITTGTNSVSAGSTSGMIAGDFVNISGAGSGLSSHFSRIASIDSGTTLTLVDNAVTTVSGVTMRTSLLRKAYFTALMPATGTIVIGAKRRNGMTADAIYISKMTLVPFGRYWPNHGYNQ